jgi:DNA-binding TFAR19-related protein (PDSD5 family)
MAIISFHQTDRARERLSNHSLSQGALGKQHRSQVDQLARESQLAQRLTHLAGADDLDASWAEFEAIVRHVKAIDLAALRPVEQAFEDEDEVGVDDLPLRLAAIGRALRTDLTEAWSRLRARSLIRELKPMGSLRALAEKVRVSAPYLSQLSSGAGPVPSEAILRRLEEGLRQERRPIPDAAPAPSAMLQELDRRFDDAEQRLARLRLGRTKPQVSVEYPDSRRRRQIEECLRLLAERLVDPDEGKLTEELAGLIVSADISELSQLAQVARTDGLRELLTSALALTNDQRQAIFALIRTMPPAALAVAVRPPKQKSPNPAPRTMQGGTTSKTTTAND